MAMIRAVLQIVPDDAGYHAEAFDQAGADLLSIPSPIFTTAGEAETFALAELHRKGFHFDEIFIDHP